MKFVFLCKLTVIKCKTSFSSCPVVMVLDSRGYNQELHKYACFLSRRLDANITEVNKKYRVHPCTGTEALYRPYDP